MPPKYVFNYVALYDDTVGLWKIFQKHDKRIPKDVACYGGRVLGVGESIDSAIKDAECNGVKHYDVQVVE